MAEGLVQGGGLAADGLRRRLRTRVLGTSLQVYDQVGSTNDLAYQAGIQGAPEGTLILADHQIRGRGQKGRTWFSPPGCNLYFSLLLRPSWEPSRIPWIPLMAGVAVAETLKQTWGLCPRLKWPNDVLLKGRKVAGILTEVASQGFRLQFLVLGIGVNVNRPSFPPPSPIRSRYICLEEVLGEPVDRISFLLTLLDSLEKGYMDLGAGTESLQARWEAWARIQGTYLQIHTPEGEFRGWGMGLSPRGGLQVQVEGGGIREILSGEVQLLEEGDEP